MKIAINTGSGFNLSHDTIKEIYKRNPSSPAIQLLCPDDDEMRDYWRTIWTLIDGNYYSAQLCYGQNIKGRMCHTLIEVLEEFPEGDIKILDVPDEYAGLIELCDQDNGVEWIQTIPKTWG